MSPAPRRSAPTSSPISPGRDPDPRVPPGTLPPLSGTHLAVLVAALVLGGFAGLLLVWIGPLPRVVNDAAQYVTLAASIVTRGEYAYFPGEPTAWRSPGYPFFLAAFASVGITNPKIVCTVHVLLHVLTATLVFGLSRRLFPTAAAVTAASLVAVWPPLLSMATHLLTETPAAFLIVATLYATVRAGEPGARARWLALAGLGWGIGILVRPSLLFVPLPLAALFATHRPVGNRLRIAATVISLGLLLQTPWVVRNALVFGKFIPTNTNSGISLFRGFYVPWDGINQGWKAPPLSDLTRGLDHRRSEDGIRIDRIGREHALRSIADEPGAALWLYVRKICRLWDPTPNNPRQVFGSLVLYHALRTAHLAALALAGIAAAARPLAPRLLLFAVVSLWTLFHAFFEAQPRYALPVLPLVLILTADATRRLASRTIPGAPGRS